MRSRRYAGLITAFFMAACARQADIESSSTPSPVTPADTRALPPGTPLDVELDKEIGTKVSRVGEVFSATVIRPVVAVTGDVAVPVRSKVWGRVTGVDNSDHVGEAAAIKVDWDHIEVNGERHMLDAEVTDTDVQTRGESTNETLRKAGIGAAAGAVLGAVLSGGDIGSILKGGAIGAAAGTVISLGMGDVEAVLPVGTRMQLETTRTIDLRSSTPRR